MTNDDDEEYDGPMRFHLEEFFCAIHAFYEEVIEDVEGPDFLLSKHSFQHLVIDALEMMCECGHCDDIDPDQKATDYQLAMLSLFGNMDDVDVTVCGDVYEAKHKNGLKAEWKCSETDREANMIKAMEKLHAMLG